MTATAAWYACQSWGRVAVHAHRAGAPGGGGRGRAVLCRPLAGHVSGRGAGRPAVRCPSEEVPAMILLDTDILIDLALDRHPHAGPAADLLDRIEHGAERACIA